MPGFTARRGPEVSLVQDQDIYLVKPSKADLTITVIGSAEQDGTKHVTDIYVSNDVCRNSRYLRPLIDLSEDPTELTLGGELKRSGSNTHGQDEGENLEGLLVGLSHIHGLTEDRMGELGLYKITVLGVWYAIGFVERDQYGDAKNDLKSWFNKWYATSMEKMELNIDTARALALPCQLFDHAAGFARVTKWLAYNHIGHIKERPPKGFKGSKGLHVPAGEFVGPINHARGGLKTTLHKGLYKKCGHLLRYGVDQCTCWDSTVGQYFRALTKIDVFPVDDVISYSSIQQIINRLEMFEYDFIPACARCRGMDWKSVVLKTMSHAEGYFNGLCLDCMDRSKPKGKNVDDEYWRHNESVSGRWDTRCRNKHNQSTWYVSWLGRPEIREKIMRRPDGYRAPDED